MPRAKVAVSRCLLGDPVRYDGRSSRNTVIIEKLGMLFDLIPVCPEVEAGLSIPRPPVQLSGSITQPQLTGRDDPEIDVTAAISHYCANKPAQLSHIAGYIFKSRSPSCGLNSTPVFIEGECVTELSRGLFARAMCERYPALPVIEETELEAGLNNFIAAVNHYINTSHKIS